MLLTTDLATKNREKPQKLKRCTKTVEYQYPKTFYNKAYGKFDLSGVYFKKIIHEIANFINSSGRENLTVLDVGCGSGKFAEMMLNAGYQVDCVSPSPNLTKHVRERLGKRSEIFECRFEELSTNKRYDLIVCSESFQYLLLEKAMEQTFTLLNNRGHLLICDFFQRNVSGKVRSVEDTKLRDFLNTCNRSPLHKLPTKT